MTASPEQQEIVVSCFQEARHGEALAVTRRYTMSYHEVPTPHNNALGSQTSHVWLGHAAS